MANKKVENEKLDKIMAKYTGRNGSLIPVLQETQEKLGYISQESMERLAGWMKIPLSQVYGVVTFYAQFKLSPVGKRIIKVCHGTACYVSGAQEITGAIGDELGIEEGETTKDREFTLESVACLGCCGLAPVMMIEDETYGKLTAKQALVIIKKRKR